MTNCVCRLLFPFPPEKEACRRWYAEERTRLRPAEPYAGSLWYRAIHNTNREARARGELLRATLLSGGAIYGALSTFTVLRKLKAADVAKGIITTDVEWAHNCEGIRAFFELDYRSTAGFPREAEVMTHLAYVQQVIREAYPLLAHAQYEMHVATCSPVVTEGRVCKWGVHLVFPHIVTTTQQLRVLAGAVDTKITRHCPEWKDVVDVASYKEANATLRPPFSYKAEKCALCAASRRGTKRPRATEDLPLTPEELLATDCDCWYGYRVQPSVYTYRTSILPSQGTAGGCSCMAGIEARYALLDIESVLHGMSIQPRNGGMFTSEFKACPDMYERVPTVPKRGASKENKIHGVNKRRKEVGIPSGYQKSCHAILQAAINRTHAWYRSTVIETIRYYPCKKYGEFFITVKGPGMRACLHSNKVHRSNRIYFVLRVYTWTLTMGCFDTACAHDMKETTQGRTFALLYHEIAALGTIPLPGLHVPVRSISTTGPPPPTTVPAKTHNIFQLTAIERYNECQRRIQCLRADQ